MIVAEALLHALLAQTVALTLAVVAVRGLQALALGRLGAGAAYIAWLLVPVAMLAVALPHPAAAALVVHVDVSAIAPAWALAVSAPGGGTGSVVAAMLAGAWLAGALLLAASLALRQRRFESTLKHAPGAPARLPSGAGPAVLGLLRPRIVLPQDFETGFDARERRLMLRHEHVHLRRRDNAWNLLASALLVVHWFNPVAWWALRRVRADQETACDVAVLRRAAPRVLAAYARALLKVQGVALAAPFATSWQATHPLVERIRMLEGHRISPARDRLGRRMAGLFVLVAGLASYTLHAGALPAAPENASVLTAVEVTDTTHRAAAAGGSTKNAVNSQFRLVTRLGEQAVVRLAEGDREGPLEIGMTVSRASGGQLQIDARLSAGTLAVTLGTPRLLVRDGERADVRIRTDDGAHEVAVSFLPRVVDKPMPPVPSLAAPPAPAQLPAVPPAPSVDAPRALPATPPVDAVPPVPAAPPAPQRAP